MSSSGAPTPVPVSQRRRRPRLSPDEIAERMYAAAREILFQQGITITLEDLSLDDVIASAGVPRSSVYRKWPYKGDFVADLLVNLAGPDWMTSASFDEQTLLAAASVILDRWDEVASPEGRRSVFVELVRTGVNHNFAGLLASGQWYVFYTLCVTARPPTPGLDDESRVKLLAAVHAAAQSYIDVMAGFYQLIGSVLGLRPRAQECTIRHIVAAGAAVVEGLAVNQIVATAYDSIPDRPATWSLSELASGPLPGPVGHPGEWSLAALAYLAILDSMLEPDPQWSYDDRLRTRLVETLESARPRAN